MTEDFGCHFFGPLNHPRAGARILYRVRLRLLDEWRANDCGLEWRDAIDEALELIDQVLDAHWLRK